MARRCKLVYKFIKQTALLGCTDFSAAAAPKTVTLLGRATILPVAVCCSGKVHTERDGWGLLWGVSLSGLCPFAQVPQAFGHRPHFWRLHSVLFRLREILSNWGKNITNLTRCCHLSAAKWNPPTAVVSVAQIKRVCAVLWCSWTPTVQSCSYVGYCLITGISY